MRVTEVLVLSRTTLGHSLGSEVDHRRWNIKRLTCSRAGRNCIGVERGQRGGKVLHDAVLAHDAARLSLRLGIACAQKPMSVWR